MIVSVEAEHKQHCDYCHCKINDSVASVFTTCVYYINSYGTLLH